MKRVIILCRRDDRESYDTRSSMLQGLATVETEVEYTGADFEDLLFSFDGETLRVVDSVSGVDIAEYDALFLIGWFKSKSLDDVARAVAHYAQAHGVACANSEAYYGRSFTKLSQCVMAALNGVVVTPFLFALDQTVLLKAVEQGNLGFPYIAKAISASRGQDNYLITSHDQLAAAMSQASDVPKYFIVQQFIPNDGDYRVLVMGDRVQLVIHRLAQGDSHLNNTSQGGRASLTELSELPEKVLADCVRIAKLFRREVTGVDMIKHRSTGKFYFLEVNNMPQLSTGSFVPEKLQLLSDYLSSLANGKAPHYID